MATPDVLFPITLPASDAGRKVTGHLRYIGADDLRSSAHGFTASSAIGHLTSIRAVDGLITFPDVTPNILITSPPGTVYELVVEYWDGTRDEPEYATVGNVAGPVTWGDANCPLTDPPASLTSAASALAIASEAAARTAADTAEATTRAAADTAEATARAAAITAEATARAAADTTNATAITTEAAARAAADAALEPITVRTVDTKTTDYTLVLGDATKELRANSAVAAVTFTVPTNASVAFPTGTKIVLSSVNVGTLTVAPVSGAVTVSGTLTVDQNSKSTLEKTGTNTWTVWAAGSTTTVGTTVDGGTATVSGTPIVLDGGTA